MGLALIIGLAIGCSSEVDPCQDVACPAGAACVDGRCACLGDEGCDADAFCNRSGFCQLRPPCRSNQDCEASTRCDLTTGRCRPPDACGADTQCAAGQVCVAGACQPGCRDDGDCGLSGQCRDILPTGVGVCADGTCDVNEDCAFGERCVGGRCFVSPNPSHCADCTDVACPFVEDFCLVNPQHDPGRPDRGSARFCGVSCAADPTLCPSGYACQTVVRLTGFRCGSGDDCGPDRVCVVQEGASEGFCTCGDDADCPNDTRAPRCVLGFCEQPAGRLCSSADDCDPLPLCGPYGPNGAPQCVGSGARCRLGRECLCRDGQCENSSRPCQVAADCLMTCEDGGCKVGEACRPRDGLTCGDVR